MNNLHRCFLPFIGCLLCAAFARTARLEAGPVAAVSVQNRGPTDLIEGDSTTTWRYLPDFIRGSTIYSVPLVPLPTDSPTSGVSDFTVTQSGKLYIAAHYDYEGNSGGNWQSERITRDQLEAQGWAYDGDARYGTGGLLRIFEKNVTAGDVYHLRVNKYTPPWVIVPTDQTGVTASNAAPWPVFGTVSVADFLPTVLEPSANGFVDIPDSLKGLTIFSEIRRPSGAMTDFKVLEDSKVLLAGFFGYDGNSDGDWVNDRVTLSQMLSQGWTETGQMTDANGRVWDVIGKNLHAGDTFSLRFNKYTAPYVIVGAVPEPAAVLLLAIGGIGALLLGQRTKPGRPLPFGPPLQQHANTMDEDNQATND